MLTHIEAATGSSLAKYLIEPHSKTDRILMALQLSAFSSLFDGNPYIPSRDRSLFTGYVVNQITSNVKDASNEEFIEVLKYFKEINEFSTQPADFVAQASMLLHESIEPDIDPDALVAIADDLDRFLLSTTMSTADHFGDRGTVRALETQLQLMSPRRKSP